MLRFSRKSPSPRVSRCSSRLLCNCFFFALAEKATARLGGAITSTTNETVADVTETWFEFQ